MTMHAVNSRPNIYRYHAHLANLTSSRIVYIL